MTVFGLTGGVASGKSTVAQRFRERGLAVIDADRLARELVVPGSVALGEIVAAFGSDVLRSDGTLDRPRLGRLVFDDEDARLRLNAILHPRIGAETLRRAEELAQAGADLACYEAALLVENGLSDAFRPLVVVALDPVVQVERLRTRDGLDRAAAEARVAAQMPLAQKIAVADHVIDNSGTREELLRRSDDVLAAIRAALSLAPLSVAPRSVPRGGAGAP
jgi:dephospho-CoA kinase